jgi:hypothetical protein
MLLDGTLPIEELDDEELARGYPRASDGSFRNPPVVIPRAIHARMMRVLFERANKTLKQNLGYASDVMVSIMNDKELDPKVRMDAAKWVIERIMGKTPEVNVTIDEKRYERLFDRLERGGDIIEGELVSDGREP